MPCLRTISEIGTPDSPSFRMLTICDSLNLDFLMAPPVGHGKSSSNCLRRGEAYVCSSPFRGRRSRNPHRASRQRERDHPKLTRSADAACSEERADKSHKEDTEKDSALGHRE